jgi:hypothetical protein
MYDPVGFNVFDIFPMRDADVSEREVVVFLGTEGDDCYWATWH